MHRLMAIYICPIHGEVLEDQCEYGEYIDTERDEVYPFMAHANGCWQEVRRKVEEGVECWSEVSEERYAWWIYCAQMGEDE